MDETNIPDKDFVDASVQAGIIAKKFRTLKGPVDTFIPRVGNPKLQHEIEETGIVPPGAFRDCGYFDDSLRAAQEQKRLRRVTPVAHFAVRLIEERLDEDGEGRARDSVAWRLMDYAVAAYRDQATVVEAAKQYFEKEIAGELYAFDDSGERVYTPQTQFIIDQLNAAMGRMYPKLNRELADEALYRAEHPDEPPTQEIMSQETRQEWHDFLHERYDPVFEQTFAQYDPDEEPIIGERLRQMTAAFMSASGLPMRKDGSDDLTKWKCEYQPNSSGFRVKSSEKLIICGTRKDPLTKEQFEKLMMHEVIVHAWRAENGSRTGYPAFQTGLPGHLEPEEGFGLLVEALWSGESPEKLSRDHLRYVGVSYAAGIYDGIKHTEQETYDYMEALVRMAGFGSETDELYRHVMRPYRGMPPGCIMPSNALYLVGKKAIMERLEEQHHAGIPVSKVFAELQSAKTNPLDPDHEDLRQAALAA